MDLVANRCSNLLLNECQVVSILGLQEQDVVWSVDEAVACDSLHEGAIFSLDAVEEVANDLLMLALHLNVVQLGDKNGVDKANLQRFQS